MEYLLVDRFNSLFITARIDVLEPESHSQFTFDVDPYILFQDFRCSGNTVFDFINNYSKHIYIYILVYISEGYS